MNGAMAGSQIAFPRTEVMMSHTISLTMLRLLRRSSTALSRREGAADPPTMSAPVDTARLYTNTAVQREIARYDPSLPIQRAFTPPSSWYTWPAIFSLEQDLVFSENWVAVDVLRAVKPGSYQTGIFNNQPYLITNNSQGDVKAFYNVCTHAGSCLVGPWTSPSSPSLDGDIRVSGGSNARNNQRCHYGELDERSQHRFMQCPFHGWQFNLDGKLIKTTHMKGIENFRNKNYDLRPIDVMVVGPIVFMRFSKGMTSADELEPTDSKTELDTVFRRTISLLEQRVESNGFVPDFGDMQFIESSEYQVDCNWKVFIDNYGDGCYHCSYAHKDLAANIDESSYFTDLVSPELSIQHAPPQVSMATTRFGTDRPAVYAYMYPNIMYNRYGPWLDVDIVKPITATSCTVLKAWFLERSFNENPSSVQGYIEDSLRSSRAVHNEDVFLCENVQVGMGSNGFDRGRYVPTKQIASYHFHKRLAADLQRELSI